MKTYEVNLFCDSCDTEWLCSQAMLTPGEAEADVERLAQNGGWILRGEFLCPKCALNRNLNRNKQKSPPTQRAEYQTYDRTKHE